ncbi:MAG: hypothetical protein AMS27_06300 [Bacteroides sp. SM23_62_1]|nr:MAG: hypothetical protein AMS27_06300 [Bacteroides sp. SM23_62_1]
MKKVILQFLLALTVTGLFAQKPDINRLFVSCRGEEDVISIYIPGFLCRLGASLGDLEDAERELLCSISSIRILVSENPELNRKINFAKEIHKGKPEDDYRILLTVHESDQDVVILGRENKGYIRDLIIAVGGDENVLVCIKGRVGSDLLDALYGVTGIEECKYMREI